MHPANLKKPGNSSLMHHRPLPCPSQITGSVSLSLFLPEVGKPAAKRAQYPPHLSATPLWVHPFMTSAVCPVGGFKEYPKFVDKQHVDFKNRGGWGKTKQKIQKYCGSPFWMAPTFLSFIQSFPLRYHYSPLNFESQVISRFSPTRSFVSLRYSAVAWSSCILANCLDLVLRVVPCSPLNVYTIFTYHKGYICLPQADPLPLSRIITTIRWLEAA